MADLISYLQAQSGLTALVPASNIWLDVAADAQLLPFLIVTVVSDVPEWDVAGNYLSRMRVRLTPYAATLSALDGIVAQLYTAMDNVIGMYGQQIGSIRENCIPHGLQAGAYSATCEWLVFEDLPRP